MATKKQIEANRRNAKKSTGPKSEEGKAKSALNATKHGLTSRRVWLSDEDGERFREFRHGVMEDLRPLGALETQMACRVAAQMWRLARVPAIEAEMFDRLRHDLIGVDEGLGGAWLRDGAPYEGALARLARYETAIERSVTRVLAELRRMQAARIARDAAEEAQILVNGPDGQPMDLATAERAWGHALENRGPAGENAGGNGAGGNGTHAGGWPGEMRNKPI